MLKYKFDPRIKFIKNIDIDPNADFRYEPMLFGSSLEHALDVGGRTTKKIIKSFGNCVGCPFGYNIIIDTRVNMLMQGFYPSIPGWHCDDFTRNSQGQPDMQYDENVKHYVVLLSDGDSKISGTEFVTETFECYLDPERVWRSLNKYVNNSSLKTRKLETNTVLQFDQNSVHRATESLSDGWRMFFRLSVSKRQIKNEIRNHVQTYVDINSVGW